MDISYYTTYAYGYPYDPCRDYYENLLRKRLGAPTIIVSKIENKSHEEPSSVQREEALKEYIKCLRTCTKNKPHVCNRFDVYGGCRSQFLMCETCLAHHTTSSLVQTKAGSWLCEACSTKPSAVAVAVTAPIRGGDDETKEEKGVVVAVPSSTSPGAAEQQGAVTAEPSRTDAMTKSKRTSESDWDLCTEAALEQRLGLLEQH